jgi:phosphoenolpyruvate carboxykinase (GTP)
MSIQDFVAIPLGKYIRNNLEFGKKLEKPPLVFGVNYFLRDKDGGFINDVRDKHVWVKWMELRVHNEVGSMVAPTGYIPKFEDLQKLFRKTFKKNYTRDDYVKQFTIRVVENLAKLERVERFHRQNVTDAPEELFRVLAQQRGRLERAMKKHGDCISPFDLAAE